MMQFVDDKVCRTLSWNSTVSFPTYWVSLLHINHSTTSTITADRLSKDTWCLTASDIKSIKLTFEVSLHSGCPSVITTLRKFHLLVGFSTSSCLIKAERWFRGSVETEGCLTWRIGHLVESLLCCNIL